MTSSNFKYSIMPIEGCYMFEGHEVIMQHAVDEEESIKITEIKDGRTVIQHLVPFETAHDKAEQLLKWGYTRY
tara:strand:- start:2924 stop:3142 length:219 start_codon:yes stop_codon:yes gene_type:complete